MTQANEGARPLAAPHLLQAFDADLLDVSTAARLSGLTTQHFRSLLRDEKGPRWFQATEEKVRIPRAELEEWLAQRAEQAGPVRRPRARSACRTFRWLPLEPLRQAVDEFSPSRLAEWADVSLRTAVRWVVFDEIPYYPADRAACALGFHPCLIWGESWWQESDSDGQHSHLRRGARCVAEAMR
jgi:predicted DNA-binding transcriptional regulator AlpA